MSDHNGTTMNGVGFMYKSYRVLFELEGDQPHGAPQSSALVYCSSMLLCSARRPVARGEALVTLPPVASVVEGGHVPEPCVVVTLPGACLQCT